MRILYGVQGTGNGHLTRARVMAKALADVGAQVDWVFSGRPKEKFFDMEGFGDYQVYRGLTFATRSGKIRYMETALTNNVWQFYQDIKKINVEGYDFILNDFEPVSAWAARRAGKQVIGISHQSAFFYDIPKHGENIFTKWFMRSFAPVTLPVGLHWHHFNQPILPPIVEPPRYTNESVPRHYLVYLPFSEPSDILPRLRHFPDYQFYVYLPVPAAFDDEHIHIRPFSREGFQQDLHRCEGVICSTGFELPSEALLLGKKILTQPVVGQMEQQSNALALQQLGYASVTKTLDVETIGKWLSQPKPAPIPYPNVAQALVEWLLTSRGNNLQALQEKLWQDCRERKPR